MKVAIIGAGDMGKWFAEFAKKLGRVTISDINKVKAKKVASELRISAEPIIKATRRSDLIVVAVPISKTPSILKRLAKNARPGTLLTDLASVKSDVVEAMQKIDAKIELVSFHPLFGPRAVTIRDKDVVVVPVKPGKRYWELKKIFKRSGARITEMDADTHDRVMAIIQCMTHFVLISYVHYLKSIKLNKKYAKLRTPMSDALTNLSKAILAGNAKVFSEIQAHNKFSKNVRKSFIESSRSLHLAFKTGEAKSVEKVFCDALKGIGTHEARLAYNIVYSQFEEIV